MARSAVWFMVVLYRLFLCCKSTEFCLHREIYPCLFDENGRFRDEPALWGGGIPASVSSRASGLRPIYGVKVDQPLARLWTEAGMPPFHNRGVNKNGLRVGNPFFE